MAVARQLFRCATTVGLLRFAPYVTIRPVREPEIAPAVRVRRWFSEGKPIPQASHAPVRRALQLQ